MTLFENQRAFNTLADQRGTIINSLYENDRKKCYKTTPAINTDNNWHDNVITNENTNKINHLNYRYQKVYQDGTDKTGYNTNTLFGKNIKEKERHHTSFDLNKNFDFQSVNQQRRDCNMGSNVSRNTAKGLSGRRTQSSGLLLTQ